MAFVRATTTGQTWNPTANEINSFSNKANSFGRLGEGDIVGVQANEGQSGIINVLNVSNVDIEKGTAVSSIGPYIINKYHDGYNCYERVTPYKGYGRWYIAIEDIKQNDFGDVISTGICIVNNKRIWASDNGFGYIKPYIGGKDFYEIENGMVATPYGRLLRSSFNKSEIELFNNASSYNGPFTVMLTDRTTYGEPKPLANPESIYPLEKFLNDYDGNDGVITWQSGRFRIKSPYVGVTSFDGYNFRATAVANCIDDTIIKPPVGEPDPFPDKEEFQQKEDISSSQIEAGQTRICVSQNLYKHQRWDIYSRGISGFINYGNEAIPVPICSFPLEPNWIDNKYSVFCVSNGQSATIEVTKGADFGIPYNKKAGFDYYPLAVVIKGEVFQIQYGNINAGFSQKQGTNLFSSCMNRLFGFRKKKEPTDVVAGQ